MKEVQELNQKKSVEPPSRPARQPKQSDKELARQLAEEAAKPGKKRSRRYEVLRPLSNSGVVYTPGSKVTLSLTDDDHQLLVDKGVLRPLRELKVVEPEEHKEKE